MHETTSRDWCSEKSVDERLAVRIEHQRHFISNKDLRECERVSEKSLSFSPRLQWKRSSVALDFKLVDQQESVTVRDH